MITAGRQATEMTGRLRLPQNFRPIPMPTQSNSAESLFFAGNDRLAEGDMDGAEACYREALRLDPGSSEALANLALLRERAGAIEEAESCYRQAIERDPDCAQNLLNLGVLLLNARRLGEAEVLNRQALELTPDSPVAWSNLGVVLACMKREDEAESCYRGALALDSGYAKARFNLAYVLLRQGRLEEGWASLEARDWYARLEDLFACPRWQGESLDGKSIVIGLEAGHGDMIQFARYAGLIKARGAAHVTLLCHPALANLFRTLSGVDRVVSAAEWASGTEWDYWVPPMSLPHLFGSRLDSLPAAIPYLEATPERKAAWQPLLPPEGARVGLVWKGNPRFENDAERSLSTLDVLAPLAAVQGIQFISLQKGAGEAEAANPPAGMSITTLGPLMQDFADMAAIVSCLDLVISVDTAAAHLAGALGIPCWVLLPDYKTDWRWFTGRDDSPWYPGKMRLFRQAPGAGWGPVVASLAAALKVWKDERR